VRLVFVNRFYWPDEPATAQLLTDLAEALAARGFVVSVIASRPGRSPAPRSENRHGVNIHRVRTTHRGRRSLAGHIPDFATFYFGAWWRLLRIMRQGDAVIMMTDPPLLGSVVWPLVRWRGARLIHWVQDIYPEIALVRSGRRWPGVLRPLRNLAWRRARACVAPGVDMGAQFAAAGVAAETIAVIPNWAPAGVRPPSAAETAELRRGWGVAEKFVAMYSGNFGQVHELEVLLDVAAALGAEPDIVLVLVGDGPQRAALERAARGRGLGNVRFQPSQPRERLGVSLAVGDVHFVTLRPGYASLVFPSKLYGIAAAGRPAIFVGPRNAEPARLIEAHGFGAVFPPDAIAGIVQTVRDLRDDAGRREQMGCAARAFAEGGAAAAADRWAELVTAKIASAGRHP
jgi:glycosyltransferase involved in cell wall biosynthesis